MSNTSQLKLGLSINHHSFSPSRQSYPCCSLRRTTSEKQISASESEYRSHRQILPLLNDRTKEIWLFEGLDQQGISVTLEYSPMWRRYDGYQIHFNHSHRGIITLTASELFAASGKAGKRTRIRSPSRICEVANVQLHMVLVVRDIHPECSHFQILGANERYESTFKTPQPLLENYFGATSCCKQSVFCGSWNLRIWVMLNESEIYFVEFLASVFYYQPEPS